ncbi:MAG: phosphocholine cytidylyltransferase family protein [Gammaproteobacteria bacterium]
MRAIILAAGVGKRLTAAHDGPKCLLEFGGQSLLARHLRLLGELGVDGVDLVLGHRGEEVVAALAALDGPPVLVHYNPLYTLGSIVSLWCARHALLRGEDVLLMDADVLYDRRILERLVAGPARDAFLLDGDFEPGEEPVKICLQGDRIVEFRKRLAPGLAYNRVGESVGFFRFSPATALGLARLAAAYVADERRELPHEEALRELALDPASDIEVEDVTGLSWIEIDFPEDVTRATDTILPAIA